MKMYDVPFLVNVKTMKMYDVPFLVNVKTMKMYDGRKGPSLLCAEFRNTLGAMRNAML